MEELSSLVVAAQGGNKEAFGQIVGRFQDMAYAGAFAMLGDSFLAQDAAQEAFMDAYLSLRKLREPAAFPGWFRRIVIKHSDRLIRGKRVSMVPFEVALRIPGAMPSPAVALERLELKKALADAIATLPEGQQLVTTLFYLQEYSYKEMADFLEIPISTIKKRLYTARKRLKGRIGTMLQEHLQENRPSQSDEFTNKVQFLIALRTGDLDQVKKLVEKDPNLLHLRTELGGAVSFGYYSPADFTALHWAAGTGDEPLLRYLRACGADVNATTKIGMTPLHVAVLMGRAEIARLLLTHVVDLNAQNAVGQTALHLAVLRNNVEITELLLAHGIKVNVADKHQRTPVDWAVQKNFAQLVELLVAHGAANRAAKVVNQAKTRSSEQKRLVPVGERLLGRTLNGMGQAIDGLSPLSDAPQNAIYSVAKPSSSVILQTGVKIIDLFAPLKRGGHNGLFTPAWGVGKQVTLSQLVHNMAAHHNGYTVCIGLEEDAWTANSLMLAWREWGADKAVVHVFGQNDDPVSKRLQIAETGVTIAEHFRSQGHDVLLLVDGKLAESPGILPYLNANIMSTSAAAITTLYYGEYTVGLEPPALANLDAVIAFDVARAKQGLWPAVDPLRSRSTLLQAQLAGTTHAEVNTQAKKVFQRYQDLRVMVERRGADRLSSQQNRQIAIRARRLHRFLTQPLVGVEPWTALPGQHVPIQDTLQGAQTILDGQHDARPEDAFYFIGTIEQAVAKARRI